MRKKVNKKIASFGQSMKYNYYSDIKLSEIIIVDDRLKDFLLFCLPGRLFYIELFATSICRFGFMSIHYYSNEWKLDHYIPYLLILVNFLF